MGYAIVVPQVRLNVWTKTLIPHLRLAPSKISEAVVARGGSGTHCVDERACLRAALVTALPEASVSFHRSGASSVPSRSCSRAFVFSVLAGRPNGDGGGGGGGGGGGWRRIIFGTCPSFGRATCRQDNNCRDTIFWSASDSLAS